MALKRDALDLIGNTPAVDVSVLSPNPDVRLVAKLESANPTGSVKDRIAKAMVLDAEADGTLGPGKRILEPSSGNTGIALAMIARMRGYPITVVMPENTSVERRQMLEVFGAEIVPSPGAEGSNGAVRLARRMILDHPDWVFLYQYANEANPRVHYETTGPEILRDVGDITHFVAGLGTSGTVLGVGTYLKEMHPDIEVYAVEPPAGELVDGLRSLDDGFIPPVYEKWGGADLLSGKRIVRPRESVEYTRRLAGAGIFAGLSSGAALAGACRVASRINTGTVVFIVSDGGWKYLSQPGMDGRPRRRGRAGLPDHLLLGTAAKLMWVAAPRGRKPRQFRVAVEPGRWLASLLRMSKICQVTGKKPRFGKQLSHSHRRSSRRWDPNVQTKRYYLPSEKRWIKLRLSTKAIKTIDRRGIESVVAEMRRNGRKI